MLYFRFYFSSFYLFHIVNFMFYNLIDSLYIFKVLLYRLRFLLWSSFHFTRLVGFEKKVATLVNHLVSILTSLTLLLFNYCRPKKNMLVTHLHIYRLYIFTIIPGLIYNWVIIRKHCFLGSSIFKLNTKRVFPQSKCLSTNCNQKHNVINIPFT